MEYKRYNKYVYGLRGLRGKPKSYTWCIFLFLFIAGACSLFLYVKELKEFFSLLEQVPVVREYSVVTLPTTAYSEFDSCHYRDCLMANGERAYYGAVASNCLPFGTTLVIDDKEFVVKDRHSRYLNCRADIFMGYGEESYINAKRYGVVNKLIKIL